MDVLLDSGLLMDPAVLAVLAESRPGGKKRRKVVIPQPRRGELEGHGQVRWRIPIQPGVWEELERHMVFTIQAHGQVRGSEASLGSPRPSMMNSCRRLVSTRCCVAKIFMATVCVDHSQSQWSSKWLLC